MLLLVFMDQNIRYDINDYKVFKKLISRYTK